MNLEADFRAMNRRTVLASILSALFLGTSLTADNEIGFVEKFALAPDREAVLGQLVPGTEDYYFFHALHYQNTGQKPKLTPLLEQWAKRYPDSVRRRIIENREALLVYDADPQATLKFLRERLGLSFDHVQEVRDRKPDLPTVLDAARINHPVFLQNALADDGLNGLSAENLERLVRDKTPLRPPQRRALLGKLTRPDVPGLVEVVAEDLKTKESRGFGEFGIHGALLPDQLDRLRELAPVVTNQQAYVHARIRKLAAGADADPEFDPVEREAWLTRVWDYVRTLPPAFNSLKAHILHARLQFDRTRGVYDRARFMEYLKLPRAMPYMNPKYLEQVDGGRRGADLNARFEDLRLGLPPVGSDEVLVREFVMRLSVDEASWEPWAEWLRDTWVKPVFAEAKITAGAAEPEKWASLLSPAAYQALRERVDIEFPATNPAFLPVDADVAVDVVLKNTPKLIVRIYEINTLGFHLGQNRPLNTDLNLDGLVANSEQTHDGDASPFKRVSRKFQFPELKGRRGAWVIEFIGGGKSSRALIRKGRYTLVQRTGPAGELLTVLDENRRHATNAVAWLDGRKLSADPKDGRILVPFTATPGRRPIVLADPDGSFASVAQFDHSGEQYDLDVQFHIEREQLLARREATLAVRPTLRLGGEVVNPTLLEDVRIVITSTTHDGIDTTSEVKAPKLSAERLFTHGFRVPDRLAKIRAELYAHIPVLTKGGEKQELFRAEVWDLNGIDRTEATYGGHFARFGVDHVFELLGRNGEPVPDQQILFTFHRRGFQNPETVALGTDARGRVQLGRLDDIDRVLAKAPNEAVSQLSIRDSLRTWPSDLHARVGEPIQIPWSLPLDGGAVSLLELRGTEFVADRTAVVKQQGAFLEISGLPAGDYSLRLRDDQDREVHLRIADGDPVGRWLVGANRSLELRAPRPLQVESVRLDTNQLTIQLRNWNAFTRVHVAASRFLPSGSLFDGLAGFQRPGASWETPDRLPNLYSGGRAIGDEYRYILERRYATKYPGNMLPRPGLLLNPWDKRTTDTQALAMGGRQDPAAMAGDRAAAKVAAAMDASMGGGGGAAVGLNLDFLAEPAPVLFNLVPDTNGVVRIPASALGDRQTVQVHAESIEDAVWGLYALGEQPTRFRDLRLSRNLDPTQPFTEAKEINILGKGSTLTITNLLAGDLETYDTLASVHALFTTLNPDPNLAKFSWILQWPKLTDAEKRARYSEFACHELNYFLSRKDPRFFAEVIQPYLRNKKDKTFLDEYLLSLDLTRHLEPWAYARLNVFERALLAQRLPGEATNTARSLRELWEVVPPDPEKADRIFETALRGRAMEQPVGEVTNSPSDRFRMEADKAVRYGLVGADAKSRPMATAALPGTAGGAPASPELLSRRNLNGRFAGGGLGGPAQPPSPSSAPMGSVMRGVELEQLAELADQPVVGLEFAKAERAAALARAYYRPLGPTKEWAENNYYRLPIEGQHAALVSINAFWRDFGLWDGKSPFLSPHFAEANRNFTEMLLALAVLDLPFEAPAHTVKSEGSTFTFITAGPVIVFQKQFKPATKPGPSTPSLLVSESYFRQGDRYRVEGNEKFDKFVTEEFLSGVVYGAHLVVGNPGSSPIKVDLLTQIPRGAIPVLGGKVTQNRYVRLEPYATAQFEYHFYFPVPTTNATPFPHFPAQASISGTAAGTAKPLDFQVVRQLSKIDTASWEYVSQQGTEAEVFAFLEQNNLARLDLEKVAWRARNSVDFFRRIIAFLGRHHTWSEPLYRYAVVHNDAAVLREWLRHREDFIEACGDYLASKLVTIDPIERRTYEHLEYSPLVNQRAHRVGSEHRIANPVIRAQYQRLLRILGYRATLDPMDQLSVVYHLFLQDRIEEALARLKGITALDSLPTRLQLDYLRCYAALYEERLADARGIAARYADHPVDRWRTLFAEVTAQLDEIEGRKVTRPGDKPDREKQQAELAAAESTFDFKVENRSVSLTWRNLREVTVNYYLMDPEFLFSSSPFVTSDPNRFSIIKPTMSVVQALPEGRDALDIPVPGRFAQANVLVEVLGGGRRRTQAYHANTFKLSVAENQGRLELRDQSSDKSVSKAYVKVYARLQGGTVRFLKDGYTDLRGRFDYASLNDSTSPTPAPVSARGGPASEASGLDYQMLRPDEIDRVEKLAVLVLSDSHGAAVRELDPPRK